MALSTAFNDDLMHDPFSLSAPPDAPDAFGFEQIEFDLEQSDATGSGFIWSEGAFNLVLPPEELAQYAQGNPYVDNMHGQGLANQSPLSSVGSIYDSMPGILNMPLSEGTVNDLQPGSLPPFPGDAITQNDMGAEDFQELFASLDGVFLHAPGTVSQPVLVQPENIASSRVVSFASTVASPVTSSITSPITSLVAPPVAPWAVQNASKPKDPGASHGKHKTLFGAKGWLASTEDGRSPIRKKSVIKGLQHKFNLNFLKMTYMVPPNDPSEWDIDFLANANGNQLVLGPPGSAPERTPITLGPAAQAALYSDLEAMICDTANKFLLQQYYDGHISQQSLDNIMNSWSAKGRPAVTEFRYDQTYQLRLIMANRRTMEFAGQAGINPVHLTKVLQDWKVIAREMTVRTFCVADSVIRKHLHDAELLLAMLDAPDPTITAFDQLNTYARSKMA